MIVTNANGLFFSTPLVLLESVFVYCCLSIPKDKLIFRVGFQSFLTVGGFTLYHDSVYVFNLCVHPDHRGKRIGTKILMECGKIALQNDLEWVSGSIDNSNSVALGLYKRLAAQVCFRNFDDVSGDLFYSHQDQIAYTAGKNSRIRSTAKDGLKACEVMLQKYQSKPVPTNAILLLGIVLSLAT